jgi:hypothetical protein
MPPNGPVVSVDTGRLRRAAAAADYPLLHLSLDAGLDGSAVNRVLARGRCGLYTLDAIACQLCAHPSEFMQQARA